MKLVGIETTPNPNALKFNVAEELTEGTSKSYNSIEEATRDPLARAIFEFTGVQSVFYLDQFVSVTKSSEVAWDSLMEDIKKVLKNFDLSDLVQSDENKSTVASSTDSDDLLTKINEVIDIYVRPALAGDGGGLEVLAIEGQAVHIRYQGACGSCPSSIQGTLVAIENLVQEKVDSRLTVVSV